MGVLWGCCGGAVGVLTGWEGRVTDKEVQIRDDRDFPVVLFVQGGKLNLF